MSSSHKGKAIRRISRPERAWVTAPVQSIRPVADPEAVCVICDEAGADWYGVGGDAVHIKCWQRKIASPRKNFF